MFTIFWCIRIQILYSSINYIIIVTITRLVYNNDLFKCVQLQYHNFHFRSQTLAMKRNLVEQNFRSCSFFYLIIPEWIVNVLLDLFKVNVFCQTRGNVIQYVDISSLRCFSYLIYKMSYYNLYCNVFSRTFQSRTIPNSIPTYQTIILSKHNY